MELNIKSAAPFDIEQIVELIRLCGQDEERDLITFDHLDDVLFGRHSCLKALVARRNLQVIGCLFYQHSFSITNCRYDVQEKHSYVLPNIGTEHVKRELRLHLKTQLEALKPRRRELVSLKDGRAVV